MKKTKLLPCLVLALAVTLSSCKSKKDSDSIGAPESIPAELSPVLKRAKAGDADAQFEFFRQFRQLARTKEDQAEAAKWCIKAAEQGNVQALGFVYDLYDHGQGVPRDPVKALEWLLKAADAKQSYMLSRWVAERYEQGEGTPKNTEKAILWYQKALDQNDREAAFRLGEIYWNGNGIPRDYAEAVAYFKEATVSGADGAHFYLAKAYTDGNGATKDPVEAYAWIRTVALGAEGMTLKRLLENILTEEQKKEAERMTPKLKEAANKLHKERMEARSKI
jgi:uncharacterized protein